jgi:tetratricopeptide (TPR) repeat protein
VIQDGSLLNDAAESLLTQMGVILTETGRRTLMTGRYMAARAEAGYARGVAAEAGGAAVEALLNFSQAVAFDPSRFEALTRLGSVSSEISGGSISADILNDLQARDAWLEALKEAAAFFNSRPPFEISYDPNLLQIGDTDYAKRQADLAMRISLTPSEAGFSALNALIEGLDKTEKRGRWGFAGWPLLPITPQKAPEVMLFPGKHSFSFTVEAGLVNEAGKVIARGKTTLKTGEFSFKAGDPALKPPESAFGQISFPGVNAADLTPTLTVVIAGVNGLSGREISESGYMRIAPGDVLAQRVKSYADSGKAYADKRDYDRAIADYTEAIRLNPDYATAYNNRGNVYHNNKKDYDRAIADYTEALRIDPKYVIAYNNRGRAYYNKKDYDRAIEDYNEAVRFDPDNAAAKSSLVAAYHSRGDAYRNKKDYDRAIADYTEAVRFNPDKAAAYTIRGDAYRNNNDYDRAIADYTRAIELDPNYFYAKSGLAYVYVNSGNVYRGQKNYRSARAEYEKALQLDPSNMYARNNLEELRKMGY